MEKKQGHKLGKAAVATVLAASGAAVSLPQTTYAVTFTDLNAKADYYKPVLELAAKGIVSGYKESNGTYTFRPSASVTRGQAAKMLAMSLNLNVNNVTNPNFKDVATTNGFYKYIAALSNAGVISGFTDRTFRPNEPITRGQMAKIITLGYKFSIAKKLEHNFKDVANNYSHAYFIQTLSNLGITKGTTATTFSPGKAVTRGQLATFISRANNADAGVPKYVVTDLIGNKVYINGVAHTVSAALQPLFKEANREALIGAYIDGTISGTSLTALTTLTLNASGTATRQLIFDGGNSTYNGALKIVGSYITLRNWTLNGTTTIAETPRTTLADYTPKFASLATFALIDFTTPTNPGKDTLNPSDNNTLKPNNSGTSKTYTEKMSSILKYVDFSNTTVKNLVIEQNRTYVKASKTLPKVTISRDVEQVEIYADMDTLYIDNELNLTIYGVHNINTVYKNSYRDVFFNSSSYIKLLIVDNTYGWIDLGDHVYIDKVIMPPGKNPLDVFDDYKNDTDKIGEIVDTDGKEVDRNPIEDTVIKDVDPPKILRLRTDGDSFTATTLLRANEDGKYYYSVVERGAEAPTVRQILQGHGVTSGNGDWVGNVDDTFLIRNLESETEYDLYLVYVDNAGNISGKEMNEFETKDGTPPVVNNLALTPLAGGKRFDMTFNPSEEGDYYYYYEQGSRLSNHTVDYIIAKAEEGIYGGKGSTGAYYDGLKITERLTNLTSETPYYVYVVMIDKSGNKSLSVAYTTATTSVLDNIHPYVTGQTVEDRKLVPNIPAGGSVNVLNEFYIYFNEQLDQATAENVNNYVLSGTGIVNVPGQETIKPSQAIYSRHGANGSKVLLKIPSLTGFINGDTLRVTVQPAVIDLAENEFTNVNVVQTGQPVYNYAEYKHEDPLMPTILNLNVLRNLEGTLAEIEYTASKAGTLYYMIMPEDTDLEALGIEPRDFVDEFGNRPSGKFNIPSGKRYLEGAGNLPAARSANLGTQKFNYDLTMLSPDPFISYKVYMVLRDRSGNLSPIVSDIIIADKQPPQIGNVGIASLTKNGDIPANDTRARITLESDEKGTAMYAVLPKYVLNGSGKYVLNPTVYDAAGNFKDIPGTVIGNNEAREESFRRGLTNVFTNDFIKSATNTFEVTGLEQHREYVLVMGVKDTYGNFTTRNANGQLMYRELYADGTEPSIKDKVAFRTYDNTFEITFNEAIMREYVDTNRLEKTTLTQKTAITTATPLANILTITDANGTNVTNNYKITSYTTGTRLSESSKLTIVPVSSAINLEQTLTITMNNTTKDQTINENKGHTFSADDFAKYVKRDLQAAFARIELVPYSLGRQLDVIFDIVGTSTQFEPGEKMSYYYQSYSLNTPQTDIQNLTPREIILSVNEGDRGIAASLAKGKGTVEIDRQRGQEIFKHNIGFIPNDWVVVVLEDKYGNRTLVSGRVVASPQ